MSPSGKPVIEALDFHKHYGETYAVKGVSFALNKGEIFGLIGPDGGGKTSLIRSIVSLLEIEQGDLFFQGKSVKDNAQYVRSNIGYMPQRFSLYQDLSVEENLRFFADLFHVPREERTGKLKELYSFSGLEPFKKRRAGDLSGGMKQKLALSCMLVHSPEVIVLDEPTFGVDPLSRSEFWQILLDLKAGGTSVLVSTAYMDEAAYCDNVGLMFNGRMLVQDKPGHLSSLFGEKLYALHSYKPNRATVALRESGLCSFIQLFGEGPHFSLSPGRKQEEVLSLMEKEDIPCDRIEVIEAGIEDLFLKLMEEDRHES